MEQTNAEETQFVIFSVGKEKFAIEIDLVKEIIKPETITRLPNVEKFVKGVINLRGKIIVVVDTALKLGLQEAQKTTDTRILVIKAGEETIGLIVDGCEEVKKTNKKNIKDSPELISKKIKSDYVKGVITIDKELVLFLDINKILAEQDFSINKKK